MYFVGKNDVACWSKPVEKPGNTPFWQCQHFFNTHSYFCQQSTHKLPTNICSVGKSWKKISILQLPVLLLPGGGKPMSSSHLTTGHLPVWVWPFAGWKSDCSFACRKLGIIAWPMGVIHHIFTNITMKFIMGGITEYSMLHYWLSIFYGQATSTTIIRGMKGMPFIFQFGQCNLLIPTFSGCQTVLHLDDKEWHTFAAAHWKHRKVINQLVCCTPPSKTVGISRTFPLSFKNGHWTVLFP